MIQTNQISFTTYQSEIQALDSELQYTLVAIENIKSICEQENTELTKEILEERLGLISNNFQIIYSGNELDAKIAEKKVFSPKKDTKKIKRKFFDRKKLKRPALGFAVLSIDSVDAFFRTMMADRSTEGGKGGFGGSRCEVRACPGQPACSGIGQCIVDPAAENITKTQQK